jgi:choline monooxygenase
VLDDLVAGFDAGAPIEAAAMPPPAWYTAPALYELERRAIFARAWQPLVRAAELAAPGSFASGCAAGEPWVLVNDGGQVRGFRNVCRHKGHPVATGAGVAGELRCRYHGWTYGLDGRLRSAPRIAGVAGFDREAMSLPPLRLGRWGPWWLGTREADVAPAIDVDLDRRMASAPGPGLESLELIGVRRWELACNWKVYVDNFLDGGYHVATVHPSLDAQIDMTSYRTELFARSSLQSAGPRDQGGAGLPYDRRRRIGGEALYAWIFPNLMVNRYGPFMDSNLVVPLGPERCRVDYEFYAEPGVDPDLAAASIEQAAITQDEDVAVCEAVQIGMASSAAVPGRYAPRVEIAEHHFHRLLAAALARALAA